MPTVHTQILWIVTKHSYETYIYRRNQAFLTSTLVHFMIGSAAVVQSTRLWHGSHWFAEVSRLCRQMKGSYLIAEDQS